MTDFCQLPSMLTRRVAQHIYSHSTRMRSPGPTRQTDPSRRHRTLWASILALHTHQRPWHSSRALGTYQLPLGCSGTSRGGHNGSHGHRAALRDELESVVTVAGKGLSPLGLQGLLLGCAPIANNPMASEWRLENQRLAWDPSPTPFYPSAAP